VLPVALGMAVLAGAGVVHWWLARVERKQTTATASPGAPPLKRPVAAGAGCEARRALSALTRIDRRLAQLELVPKRGFEGDVGARIGRAAVAQHAAVGKRRDLRGQALGGPPPPAPPDH